MDISISPALDIQKPAQMGSMVDGDVTWTLAVWN